MKTVVYLKRLQPLTVHTSVHSQNHGLGFRRLTYCVCNRSVISFLHVESAETTDHWVTHVYINKPRSIMTVVCLFSNLSNLSLGANTEPCRHSQGFLWVSLRAGLLPISSIPSHELCGRPLDLLYPGLPLHKTVWAVLTSGKRATCPFSLGWRL